MITDSTLLAVVEGHSTGGLPLPTARAVHRLAYLLLAARTLDDISVFADPTPDSRGRYTAVAVGKWGINFALSAFGPDDLRLEKLSKSCPASQSRSSPRRRPVMS